ncbi:hypothetical protein ONA70_04050 [Micromonospora yasonensis]|nr:hypothetical protein [Micromonospora yasonensis]MCW3839269.1 hypothetical protein [Micromonospora yasonensis]
MPDVVEAQPFPVPAGRAEHAERLRVAFHLVIPSVPGFGFSGPTRERGWNRFRVARAWAELMGRLGYDRYGAAGNDLGAFVSPEVGRADPEHVLGVHVTQVFSLPSGDADELAALTEEERGKVAFADWFVQRKGGYDKLHSTEPQNVTTRAAGAGQLRLGFPVDPYARRAGPQEHRVVERVRPGQPLRRARRTRPTGGGPPAVLREGALNTPRGAGRLDRRPSRTGNRRLSRTGR